jgi:hypothetical protein
MLTLAIPEIPDALADALANVVGVLHPNARLGETRAAIETAAGATDVFLRRLRGHLHENSLLLASLAEAAAGSSSQLEPIEIEHRLLRQLSHDLCDRIRHDDLGGARGVARRFLAILLDHTAHEARVIMNVVRSMDGPATEHFADVLFDRMLRDAARSDRAAPCREAIADLHSLYVRLVRHLQTRRADCGEIEVPHEHSGRR